MSNTWQTPAELDTLRRGFKARVRGRWMRSSTPSGESLLVGKLGRGYRVLVWPKSDGRLFIALEGLRGRGRCTSPHEAVTALDAAMGGARTKRQMRARSLYQEARRGSKSSGG